MLKNLSFFALALSLAACQSAHKSQDVAAHTSTTTTTTNVEFIDRMPAAACKIAGDWECKDARKNDVAEQYMLDKNGGLWRSVNGTKCQVTDKVEDYKVSMHPTDAAVIYYKRGGDLYVLHNQADTNSSNCPKTSKKVIMNGVKKYSVTSNTNTTIVNAALDNTGRFTAWDATKPVYTDSNIDDYQMNNCFGTQGKSFNSYVLFTIDRNYRVTKVKMNEGFFGAYDSSKEDAKSYNRIEDFKASNNVCK